MSWERSTKLPKIALENDKVEKERERIIVSGSWYIVRSSSWEWTPAGVFLCAI